MKNYILTLLLVSITAANATALTSTFNQPTIPGGVLDNYVSNTWDVTTDTDRWYSAELLVHLSSGTGSIYQDGAGSDYPPNPSLFSGTPSLEYDSYMTGGTDSETPDVIGPTPSVLGGALNLDGGVLSTFAANGASGTVIDATWASLEMPLPSGDNLMLGRVTLTNDAQGYYSYRVDTEYSSRGILGGLIVDGVMKEQVLTTWIDQENPGVALPNHVSNTWHLDTGDKKLLSTELLVHLNSGSIYQDGAGSDNPPNPADFVATPSLEFDSYLTGGTDSATPDVIGPAPSVLGGATALYDTPPVTWPVPATFATNGASGTVIDATWASLEMPLPEGELMLGRVTLTNDAVGTYKFGIWLEETEEVFFYGGVIAGGEMLGLPSQTLEWPPEPPPIPGDTNGDDVVNGADAAILASFWQQAVTQGDVGQGDFNNDGWCNDLDATILAANWGIGTAAAVPEPTVLSLLLGAILALGLFRRNRA